jgi:hypothetical protein
MVSHRTPKDTSYIGHHLRAVANDGRKYNARAPPGLDSRATFSSHFQ